ncbi:MAG: hypothetical protein WBY44_06275 [Bryobacteraceae bacterium]
MLRAVSLVTRPFRLSPFRRKQRENDAAGFAVALDLLVPAHAGLQIDLVPPDFETGGRQAPMHLLSGGAVRGAVTKEAIVIFLRHERE